ncbi:MAG: Na/Pi symporter, partial [Acidimicrobiia bacterium]|nr:Na/Pi symporter [Acidimicrobiia bacterium]
MDIDWGTLLMGLAGGLALFLVGMGQVTEALKALGDDRLRWALARLSSNRFMGATTGGLVTAVIQSSSVTTVLTVGFVSAGLLSLTQAASLIIGANLGTTVTAQVIALKITDYALALLAIGALMSVAVRRQQVRYLGTAIAGLGFVFLGMDIMSDAMSPLRTYDPFLNLMSETTNPLLALAIGAVFTGLVQSSSATTGIVVVMAADGLISLETAIAIILGANIGTCVTALLAAIGKGSDAFQAAMIHVAVNVIGASVAVFFIPQIADVVRSIGSAGTEFAAGTASPRQIANAHTLFNLGNTVVFLALLDPLVRTVRRVAPYRARRTVGEGEAAFLNDDLIETP